MAGMGIPENLKRLREREKLSQGTLAKKADVSQQLISQLEKGRNLTTKFLPKIAGALGVTVFEIDENYEDVMGDAIAIAVPHITWVSAGAMMQEEATQEAIGTIRISGLPAGDWFALTVRGDSMDRISPPESVIFVNRRQKELAANACYIIDDGEGNATYKRYRPDPMRFEPVSTNAQHEPIFPDNEPTIVGRVGLSMIRM